MTVNVAVSSSSDGKPAVPPTLVRIGVRAAAAKSNDEPDNVHHAVPNPFKCTTAFITSALFELIVVLSMEELIDITGADGTRIITVTDAAADLVKSETTTENTEVVPEDCCCAFILKAALLSCADSIGNGQVELNDGADCEQDHAYDKPRFLDPTF